MSLHIKDVPYSRSEVVLTRKEDHGGHQLAIFGLPIMKDDTNTDDATASYLPTISCSLYVGLDVCAVS